MTQFDSLTVETSIEWQRYNVSLQDGGAMYAETNPDHFIVEPWNALSSLLLILPAVYWAIRLKNRYGEYPFITCCIPLLFLGGLGSTLFHAFRVSPFFLYMDVLPTAILTLSLSIYFWTQAVGRWWIGAGIIIISIVCRMWIFSIFSPHTAINFSYAISGMVILIPLIYMLFKTHFQQSGSILFAVIFFALSLVFRETDAWEKQFFPMGTHFLWHAFSAVGALYLAEYLYFIESDRLNKRKKRSKIKVKAVSTSFYKTSGGSIL